ncbi:MAG: ATP-dependent DNA helicase RecG [Peptococcaceae bacterium]|nr:ATP-dependent DNA helicase RecG [Peptococcaceae bacterium]
MDYYLKSLAKAMKAEEKQGYLNTGAMVSFSSFLLDILPKFSELLSAELLEEAKKLAEEYSQTSPRRRRELLAVFKDKLSVLFTEAHNGWESKSGGQENKSLINNSSQSLQYVKGVGPQRFKQFANIGINTVEDLFKYFPRRYEIRRTRKIEELKDNELATVVGTVVGSQISKGKIKVVKLNIAQEHKNIHAIWFNQIYIPKQFPPGTIVSVTGKVQWKNKIPELLATDIVKGSTEGPLEEIVPVYPESGRLKSKTIRTIVKNILPQAEKYYPEILPENGNQLMPRPQAYQEIHFPSSPEALKKARGRLVIEEILFLQLALALLRSPEKQAPGLVLDGGSELVNRFFSALPFQLTKAQTRVIKEIFRDMANSRKAMTRLVQGDVGSGKTVVAMAAILKAVGSGYQAAMMAPTEVLAQQHYKALDKAFSPLGLKVVLLAGGQGKSERATILDQILSGQAQVAVGTQALIQENVAFRNLALVVTDEQHRFGVRQRTMLEDKGTNPHVLVMTATPIPRTLALTLYGDLQLSILDEMPPGRKPVITKKISERNRPSLEKFLERHISLGRQVYVVCPLVEETEKSDLVSATKTAESLKQRFPQSQVALLHGRMKSQEKEEIMERFRQGEIKVLVTTTVIEVGVDVPNASIMVVESAERFGLAQLHQLRGRVGRGQEQSYCILISNVTDNARLNILCHSEDGFRIAEEDLKIRGPGELLGLRQHGVPELRLTDLTRDSVLVEEAYVILQDALNNPGRYGKLYREVNKHYAKSKVGLN